MKHTRGPWNVYFENHKLRVDADGKKNKRYICNMVQYGNAGKPLYYYDAEAADARLIAAAPDLYFACRAALITLEDDENYYKYKDVVDTLRQAIAKATKEDT